MTDNVNRGPGDISDDAAVDQQVTTVRLAAAVTVDDDRVLLVRRSETERFLPSVWGVPCGKVDPGETTGQAALRELREETGLAGSIIRYLGESVFFSVLRGRPTRNVQSNYLVRIDGGQRDVRLPKKDQASAWLSRDEISQFDGIDDYNRNVLRQWADADHVSSAVTASSSCR
jgi:8-oxo-dGTP diphosphatase